MSCDNSESDNWFVKDSTELVRGLSRFHLGGSIFMAVEGGQNAKKPSPDSLPVQVKRVSSVHQLKKSLKALPAWLLSLFFHFLALMLLTLATFATAPPTDIPKSFDV